MSIFVDNLETDFFGIRVILLEMNYTKNSVPTFHNRQKLLFPV